MNRAGSGIVLLTAALVAMGLLAPGAQAAPDEERDTGERLEVVGLTDAEARAQDEVLRRIENLTDAELCAVQTGVATLAEDADGKSVDMTLAMLRSDMLTQHADAVTGLDLRVDTEGVYTADIYLPREQGESSAELLSKIDPRLASLAEEATQLGAKVNYLPGRATAADLCASFLAVTDAVEARSLELSNLVATNWGVDVAAGIVEVQYPKDRTEEDVREELGSLAEASKSTRVINWDLLKLVPSDEEKTEFTAGRYNDTFPYSGGNRIVQYADGEAFAECSTAFKLTSAALISAGHCGVYYGSVIDGWVQYAGDSSRIVGKTSSNLSRTGAALDILAIVPGPFGSAYSGNMYRGDQYTTQTVAVRGLAGLATGATAGVSGKSSGTKSITNINDASSINGCRAIVGMPKFCGAWEGTQTGGNSCKDGDSGGPVFAYMAGTIAVKVAGVMNAASSTRCIFTAGSVVSYIYATSWNTN